MPSVRLRRVVAERYEFPVTWRGKTLDLTTVHSLQPTTDWPDLVDDIQAADWWSDSQVSQSESASLRIFQGEIHLSHYLQPSAHLGYFKNSVCNVTLYEIKVLTRRLSVFRRSLSGEQRSLYRKRETGYSPP